MLKTIEIPPLWLVVLMVCVWAAARFAPLPTAELQWLEGVGMMVMAVGFLLMAWAGVTMSRAQTPVYPRQEPSALVTGGPFQFSRNPIYLADVIILAGWSIWQGTPVGLIAIPLFIWIITERFIKAEEAALAEKFPAEFVQWSASVRRWI